MTTWYLEIWMEGGPRIFPLDQERIALGADGSNELILEQDPTVSSIHALVERVGSAWTVRDIGSRNGTYVNGERLWRDRVLKTGDEIRLGRTKLVFRAGATASNRMTMTEVAPSPPEITRRERDLLIALCRPVLEGHMFAEPSSVKQIAEDLVVTETAIKHHLLRLYDKFAIPSDTTSRRLQLAREAIRRGAVTLKDLAGGSNKTE